MKINLFVLAIAFCVWGIQPLVAQSSDLDSLNYYRKAYNVRIQALMKAELGETLQAIGQMSIQDTAVFDADSLQRIIDRGQKIIDLDPRAQYLDRKCKYFLDRIKGKAKAKE